MTIKPKTPKTIQDKLAAALVARGEREVVPSPSGKYRCFTAMVPGPNSGRRTEERFYWLGASGALRFGRISTASSPLTATYKKWLLAKSEGLCGKIRPGGMIADYCRQPADHDGPCDPHRGTAPQPTLTALKCETCGAEAYPTPTSWQCAAYSDHKSPIVTTEPPTLIAGLTPAEHEEWLAETHGTEEQRKAAE